MPVFQYKCRDCFSVFEQLILSKSEESAVHCLSCEGADCMKVDAPVFAKIGQCDSLGCKGDDNDSCGCDSGCGCGRK